MSSGERILTSTLHFTRRHWKAGGIGILGGAIAVGAILNSFPGVGIEISPTSDPNAAPLVGVGGGSEVIIPTATVTASGVIWVCEAVGKDGTSWNTLERLGKRMKINPYGDSNGDVELRHSKGPPEKYPWAKAMREKKLVHSADIYCARIK